MHLNPSPYQKAFVKYLRSGIPIELLLKTVEPETTYYVWSTQGDDKVRPWHAANEGRIFAWDNPPATGNPGEEPGCRCKAIPYYGNPYPDAIEPVYPIETLLSVFSGFEALVLAREAIVTWNGARIAARKYPDVIRSLENYFGGKPSARLNKKGDVVMMKNGKKIRFDANNDGHGYDPHFHVEKEMPNGKWEDAGDQHMYPFKKD